MAYGVGRRAKRAVALAVIASCVGIAFAGCGLDSDGMSDDGASLDATADARADVRADSPITADGQSDAEPEAAPDALLDAPADAPLDAPADAPLDSPGDGADARDGCASSETDCLDGVDNDCNGLTDCAEPSCMPVVRCVATTPAGWNGPALYADSRAAACPITFPTAHDTFESLTFNAASCTTCVCTASGVACNGASTLDCGLAGTCVSAPVSTNAIGTTCADLAAPLVLTAADACNVAAPVAVGGSCALTSGGTPSNTAASFAKLSRMCSGPRVGGGCSAGQACLAKTPTAPHGVCVARAIPNGGAVPACPSAFPSARNVAATATSFDDTRSCTSCSCAAQPAGGTCGATVHLYGGAACSTPDAGADPLDAAASPAPLALVSDAVCHDALVSIASSFVSAVATTSVTSQGTCGSSGGVPQGTVTAKDLVAVCCEN